MTSSATQQRDLRSLEDQVNQFIKNPKVIPQKTQIQPFPSGADQYLTLLLDYDIKQGG